MEVRWDISLGTRENKMEILHLTSFEIDPDDEVERLLAERGL